MAVPPGLSALSLNDAWVMIAWHLMCILVVPCQRLNPGGNILNGMNMAHPSDLLERTTLQLWGIFFKCILWCFFGFIFSERSSSPMKFRTFQACNDWPCQSSSFRWAFQPWKPPVFIGRTCQPCWTLKLRGFPEVQEQLMSKAPSVFLCQTQRSPLEFSR